MKILEKSWHFKMGFSRPGKALENDKITKVMEIEFNVC
jgi:hypothetical protein